MENIVQIITFIIGSGIIILLAVKEVQTLGFDKIQKKVYDGFVQAEKMFEHGDNKAKFDYVVDVAKRYIPAPFNCFITESLLRKVVQKWFDLCKDFIDDGNINNSITKEE